MRLLRTKWPHLILALLLGYAVVSLFPPAVWSDNIAAVSVIIGLIGVSTFVYFKWLRNRLHSLHAWPTPEVNARIRRFMSLGNFSPRTARTPRQIVLSMLITPLIVLPLTLLMVILVDGLEDFGPTASMLAVSIPLGTLLLGPAFHGLIFRLRARYDLTNALLSVLIYLPVATVISAAMLHLSLALLHREPDSFSISLGDLFIPTYFGALMCVLTVLLYRVGIQSAPAPALTTHRLYRMTEVTVSLASYAVLAVVVLIAVG